jgi:hypothetical protein
MLRAIRLTERVIIIRGVVVDSESGGQALGVNPKVGQANEVDRKVWMQASREDQEACGDKLSKLTSKEKG